MPSKNDTMRSYILVGIEKSTIGNAGVHADKSAPELHALNSASEIRISDLFNAVKSRDNAFNPKPVNKEFINSDGTPKIFYHGTPNGTFTEFRDWQYFTPNEDYAGNYLNQGASSNGYKKMQIIRKYCKSKQHFRLCGSRLTEHTDAFRSQERKTSETLRGDFMFLHYPEVCFGLYLFYFLDTIINFFK